MSSVTRIIKSRSKRYLPPTPQRIHKPYMTLEGSQVLQLFLIENRRYVRTALFI